MTTRLAVVASDPRIDRWTMRGLSQGDLPRLRALLCGLDAADRRHRFNGGPGDAQLAAHAERALADAVVAIGALSVGRLVGALEAYGGEDGAAEAALVVDAACVGAASAQRLADDARP